MIVVGVRLFVKLFEAEAWTKYQLWGLSCSWNLVRGKLVDHAGFGGQG